MRHLIRYGEWSAIKEWGFPNKLTVEFSLKLDNEENNMEALNFRPIGEEDSEDSIYSSVKERKSVCM